MPPISFSIMTMSPGVMSIFSSISSRSRASTRSGWSSMRRPERVLATTVISSSISIVGACSIGSGSCPAAPSDSTASSKAPAMRFGDRKPM